MPNPKFKDLSNEDLIAEITNRKSGKTQTSPQVNSPLAGLMGDGGGSGAEGIVNAFRTKAGLGAMKRPGGLTDVSDLLNLVKLNKELQPRGPAPEGFVDVDGEFKQDPTYVNPTEQAGIQYKQSQVEKNAREMQEAGQAEATKQDILRSDAENMLGTIQKAKEGKEFFGFAGDLPSVPYVTGDYNKRIEWENNVNKLLSQKVLDVMTQMKQASKTGATGFGQLSNKELAVLQQASTALNKRLPPDIALKYLNEMENIQKKFLGGGGQGGSGFSGSPEDDQMNSLLDQLGAD